MELHELHVLERQSGAKRHRIAVAGTGMRRGAGEIDPAVTAGRQNGLLAPETVQRAVFHAQCDDAGTFAVLVHQQVEREILDMEMRLVLQALLVKRVENGVPGAVGSGAGAARHRLAIVERMTTERALVDLAFLGPREGNAVILELDHRRNGVAAHIFDRVLVAEPVGPLDRVVHVVLPVVALAHIVERGANAALRGNRVRPGREDLGDTGGVQACRRHAECRAKTGAAGANDDNVVMVICNLVSRHAPALLYPCPDQRHA